MFRFALLLIIGACSVRHAMARETQRGFNVKVQVLSSGHAENITKSARNSAASGTSSVHELRFGLTTTAGYFVRFAIVDPAVELVEIHGLGPEIRISSGAKDVFIPSNRSVQTISYRVQVRPGHELRDAAPVRATLLP